MDAVRELQAIVQEQVAAIAAAEQAIAKLQGTCSMLAEQLRDLRSEFEAHENTRYGVHSL